MKTKLFVLATALSIFLPKISFGQAPNLGAVSDFALFTGVGAFVNTGATTVTGDVGTDAGAFTGLLPAAVTGQIHVANPTTASAKLAVNAAYASLFATPCDSVIGVTLGSGQTLTPKVYCMGAAVTLNDNLVLDAQGNPNAVFIFKINGAFATGTFSNVVLINGASLCNVYWQVNGAFSLGNNSVFRGTLIAAGQISLLEGSTVYGRCLATVGAIDTHNNAVTIAISPVSSPITAAGATTFCANSSVVLSGNNNGGTWSNGSTAEPITVNTSGDYFLTNATASCSVVSNHILVVANPLPTDFGDLMTSVWPIAGSTLPSCQFTGNEASPYDAVTNPFIVVWAGNSMSSETETISGGNFTASTDEFDDGLGLPSIPLNGGYTYPFTVTLKTNTTTATNAYYRLWFDWNSDGNFSNDLDGNGAAATYAGMLHAAGASNITVNVKPPFTFSTNYKIRLMVTDANNTTAGAIPDFYRNGINGAATPAAVVALSNGEVEDFNAPAVILPVTFGNITADAKNCNVYLAFDYLSQQNNKQFEIEYSTNGTAWLQLAILGNTGNSGAKSYSYLHTKIAVGNNYYRIKQVDVSGNYSYSKIVMATSNCAGKERIVMYPNPVYNHLTVVLAANLGKATLRISDAVGKVVSNVASKANMNQIDTHMLLPGMYLIDVIEDGKVRYSNKFIKQ